VGRGSESLASKFPEAAALWHQSRNEDITPDSIAPWSSKKVWWQCPTHTAHEWQAKVRDVGLGSRCPFCSGNRVHETNSLASLYPEIARQWHPSRNETVRPDQVTAYSGKKYWWQCAEGHEWQTAVVHRTYGHGCPFCTGRYTKSSNTLAKLFPEVAAEWHSSKNRYIHSTTKSWHGRKNLNIAPEKRPEKNRRLKPSDISPYSAESVWWRCRFDQSHVWQAKVCDRTLKKSRCPFCAKRRITDTYNLQALHPKVARLWHRSRNLPLLPSQIAPSSNSSVWWQCAKNADHVFKSPVANIVRSWKDGHTGCPFCHGKAVNRSNSLATVKTLVLMWHSERNLPLTPSDVTPGSRRIVWWRCLQSSSHVWKKAVGGMYGAYKRGASGCPFCRGLKVTQAGSLSGRFPALMLYWDRAKNGKRRADECGLGSHHVVWWRCVRSKNHVWQRAIREVVVCWQNGGIVCPQCRDIAKGNPPTRGKSG
jgi:hypothetical protein